MLHNIQGHFGPKQIKVLHRHTFKGVAHLWFHQHNDLGIINTMTLVSATGTLFESRPFNVFGYMINMLTAQCFGKIVYLV